MVADYNHFNHRISDSGASKLVIQVQGNLHEITWLISCSYWAEVSCFPLFLSILLYSKRQIINFVKVEYSMEIIHVRLVRLISV